MSDVRRAARRVAIAFSLAALATGGARAQRLPFTFYSTDDGLAGTQIWDILEDRRGYLWVATSWGVCRYDGISFTTLSVPEGLPSPTVRSILEDSDGNLWFGTNNGVAVYDGKTIRAFDEKDGLAAGTVWAVDRDATGRIWLGSESGLVVFDHGKMRTFRADSGLASDYVYALHIARDGALWVGSRGDGLARCTADATATHLACRRLKVGDAPGAGIVHHFAEDASGRIYVATRGGGVGVWDGRDGFRRFGVAQGLASDDVYSLLLRSRGEMVVATNSSGASVCSIPDFSNCRTIDRSTGLADLSVLSLYEDREGTLWMGMEAGLARLAPTELRSYTAAEGLPDSNVYAVDAPPDGDVWVGTVHGVARLRLTADGLRREARVWTDAAGLPGNWVWVLRRDKAGQLWIGTDRGLARLVGGDRIVPVVGKDGPIRDWIFDILPRANGEVWLATLEGVVLLSRRGDGSIDRMHRFTMAEGLPTHRVVSLAEDRSGRIWAATGEDLVHFEGERFHRVPPQWGIAAGAVRVVYVDRAGALWVGGYGNLVRLVDESPAGRFRFERVAPGSGIESLLVDALGEDTDGHLLVGTNHGLLLLDPKGDEGRGRVLARYDRAAGAIASEVSHPAAITLGPDGRWWCGFKGGLTVFPAQHESPVHDGPPVGLERIRARDGRTWVQPFASVAGSGAPFEWYGGGTLRLLPEEKSVRFEMRSLTLRNESEIRYQHQLAGFERGWSEAKRESFCDYTNLPPGTYVLRARAAIADGPWGPPLELEIERQAAFWETPTFAAMASLLLAAALFAGHRVRLRQIQARSHELERVVGERTEDLARYARALEEHSHALDRANERIREADRHKSEFLAKMSHELRTPLTSILGFSELLDRTLGTVPVADRERGYLRNIQLSGNRLLEMINNLLDLARIEAGRMEVLLSRANLREAVEQARAVAEGYAVHRGVRLASRYVGAPELVEVDLGKLHQILLNLLSNAIKFSPRGGEVELVVRGLAGSDAPGGEAGYEIAVTDRGPGIPPEQRLAIFEPFRQLGSNPTLTPGSGLGLAIVRSFAVLLGGDVDVDTEPGSGTTFRIRLPVSPSALPQTATDLATLVADRRRALVYTRDRERFRRVAEHIESAGWIAVRAAKPGDLARIFREIEPALLLVESEAGGAPEWRDGLSALLHASRGRLPSWVFFRAAPDEPLSEIEIFEHVAAGAIDPDAIGSALSIAGVASSDRRALIAAPDDVTRRALAARFAREGWDVLCVATLVEAVASRGEGDFAVVVLDARIAADRPSSEVIRAAAPSAGAASTVLWIVAGDRAESALFGAGESVADDRAPGDSMRARATLDRLLAERGALAALRSER